MHTLAWVGRVQHQRTAVTGLAEVDADVVHAAAIEEEHQVATAHVLLVQMAHVVRLPRSGAGQVETCPAERVHRETGAVERSRTGRAVYIGVADLVERD